MQEEEILQTIIKHQAWEDIIYNIVNIENLDPWDIDIVKLTNSFIGYIQEMKTLDFRIPARVVVIAAILLKLKLGILYPSGIEEDFVLTEEPLISDGLDKITDQVSLLELKSLVKPRVKRKVTLEELMHSLRKAMKVKERKEERISVMRRKIRREIDVEEEDIEKRMVDLMKEIDLLLMKLKSDRVKFSQIVGKWERDQIIHHFVPLLHLSTEGKLTTEQKEFFDEIFISKK